MWENLDKVDWGQLTHAYGRANDMPRILGDMISQEEQKRAGGWDAFSGSINHQGDFYDSTVAAIPFLVEAVAHPHIPDRVVILDYFRERWLEAPEYGGDPLVDEPPGGVDVPTPTLGLEETGTSSRGDLDEDTADNGDEAFEIEDYRRMDLCAWQTGRAIQAGQPVFEDLLNDPDRQVAAAAAALLLPWSERRHQAKQALIRFVAEETNPVEQARNVLEFGVYAASGDEDILAKWIEPHWPTQVRVAATLAWAWLINPRTLPEPVASVIHSLSSPNSDAFAKLPWAGLFIRGPWRLPINMADVILRLAENEDKELRWRAVQGMAFERETSLSTAQVVPVLLKALSDDYNRIRAAAALGLAQRREAVFENEPNVIPILIDALEDYKSRDWGDACPSLDVHASVCGHAAQLLAVLSRYLTPAQKKEALHGVKRAITRYAWRQNEYVDFAGGSVQASSFLKKQHASLEKPTKWTLVNSFATIAFPLREDGDLLLKECELKLAEAYAQAPDQTITKAIAAIRQMNDRNQAIGATQWLMTLGPAAEPALEALDKMGSSKLDDYARNAALATAKYVRQSLLVECDADEETAGKADPARLQCAQWLRVVHEETPLGKRRDALMAEMIAQLGHSDIYVRSSAADGLAALTPRAEEIVAVIPTLERMLEDDTFTHIGITGAYHIKGRLFHWRQERRSPRLGAIRVLFAPGWLPEGDYMLKAMLAEATKAKAICGWSAIAQHFPIDQWHAAADEAGGLRVAEPLIRATRQHCRNQPRSDNNAPYVCEAELAETIRRLSGRIVP